MKIHKLFDVGFYFFYGRSKMIFGLVAVLVPTYKPESRQVMLICPKCYTRIPASSKFCQECGLDLTTKQMKDKNQND